MAIDPDTARERLTALKRELEALSALSQDGRATVALDQQAVGRLSRMDAMQAQAMAKAAGQRREVSLRRITQALKRVDDGEFGACEKCDEPINPKRLDFDPTATLCIACASEAEL